MYILALGLFAACAKEPVKPADSANAYQEIPIVDGFAQISEFRFRVPDQLSVKYWTDPNGKRSSAYVLFRGDEQIAYFSCPIPDIDWENGGMGKRTDGVTKERRFQKNNIDYMFRLTTYGDNSGIGFVSPYSDAQNGPDMQKGCDFEVRKEVTPQEKEQIYESLY